MHQYRVTDSHVIYPGPPFRMVADTVVMPGGDEAQRVYLSHPGAVVVAPVDDRGRVGLIHQYRHAVRARLWELPAGLRDVAGEDPAVTAARELGEEIDMVADDIRHMLTVHPSPGASDERIEIFQATGLRPIPDHQRHVRTDEEAELSVKWWPLDTALEAISSGHITNGVTVTGILAVARARDHAQSLRLFGRKRLSLAYT